MSKKSTPARELIPLTATIRQADLVAAINRVLAGVSTRATYSFLSCLWFVGREFKTTDLELWLSTTVDTFLTCDDGFAIGIPLRKLLAAVKSFSVTDGILTLSERVYMDPQMATARTSRKLFSITGPTGATITLDAYDIAEMPSLTMTLDWESIVTAPSSTFIASATKVLSAIGGKDEVRPVLQNLCVEPRDDLIRMVATDGYRLVKVETPAKCNGKQKSNPREYVSYLVSRSVVQLLAKNTKAIGEVVVWIGTELERGGDDPKWKNDPTFATFTLDDLTITTRLTVGEFPKYLQLIPESVAGEITFSSLRLIQAVNRAKVIVGTNTPFVIHVTGKWSDDPTVIALANEPGVGSLDEPMAASVRLTGSAIETPDPPSTSIYSTDAKPLKQQVNADTDDFAVGYNASFLGDGVRFCGGSRVVMGMSGNLRPTIMHDPGSSDWYIIMPIRISKDYRKVK